MNVSFETLVDALKSALAVAEMLAKITTTKWDDKAVELIRILLNDNQLLDFLRKVLSNDEVVNNTGRDRDYAILETASMFINDSFKSVVQNYNFTVEQLLIYLPLVVRLILTIMGKRG
jgi:hypothetical protein